MVGWTVHIINKAPQCTDTEKKDQICLPAAFFFVSKPACDSHCNASQKQCDHCHICTWIRWQIEMKCICHVSVRKQRNQKVRHTFKIPLSPNSSDCVWKDYKDLRSHKRPQKQRSCLHIALRQKKAVPGSSIFFWKAVLKYKVLPMIL